MHIALNFNFGLTYMFLYIYHFTNFYFSEQFEVQCPEIKSTYLKNSAR